ncbi:MAG: hypothetical protein K2J72_07355 [Oscillospiraceae bacterium]|nr:hypothetical protein [Oscillospiraceae bacterium]
MGGKKKAKKVHTKIPSKTAEIIDEIESLKYRAAALMKTDNAEITSDMTDAEIIAVMDKYLYLAEKKLAEEIRVKTEQNVMSEILKLQREIEALHQDLENIKSKGENK